MRLYYRKPVVTKDNQIVIEQVTEGKAEALPNGIRRKEISIIAELYPNLELLEQTIAAAERNYNNLKLQGKKTVFQLEAEKKALQSLKGMVEKLKSEPQKAPSESPVEEAERVEDKPEEPPVKKQPVKKPPRKPTAKKTTTRKTTTRKTTTRKPTSKKVDDKPTTKKPPRKTTRKTTKKKDDK